MKFFKFAGDLIGLGKKSYGNNDRNPRKTWVLNNVIGTVIKIGTIIALAAGALKYGIDLIYPEKSSSTSKSKMVYGMAA